MTDGIGSPRLLRVRPPSGRIRGRCPKGGDPEGPLLGNAWVQCLGRISNRHLHGHFAAGTGKHLLRALQVNSIDDLTEPFTCVCFPDVLLDVYGIR